MKIRLGFVSNSSTSSFVVPKSALTSLQIYQIKNYAQICKELLTLNRHGGLELTDSEKDNLEWCDGGWSITETAHSIRGFTTMDNFCMGSFMRVIGVPNDEIQTGD